MKLPVYEYNDPAMAAELPHSLDLVWTVKECADAFGLNEKTVRKACAEAKVLARKSGSTWLISRHDAMARWAQD